jgi:hypothetical protein
MGILILQLRKRPQVLTLIIDEANAIGAKTVIVPKCGRAYPALPWDGAVAMR